MYYRWHAVRRGRFRSPPHGRSLPATSQEDRPYMRIGSFIVIVLSLIATAFSVAVTAVGWERILFYTGWMSSSFVYPASILLYILLFGLAMMRCRTITRAAGASLIATIVALLVWVFISAVDQYSKHQSRLQSHATRPCASAACRFHDATGQRKARRWSCSRRASG